MPQPSTSARPGPKHPKGYTLAVVVERLTQDPSARLEDIAAELGVTRQAVFLALQRNRPELLAPRRSK